MASLDSFFNNGSVVLEAMSYTVDHGVPPAFSTWSIRPLYLPFGTGHGEYSPQPTFYLLAGHDGNRLATAEEDVPVS